jgi:hypothetical protein
LDVDALVDKFLEDKKQGISTLHRIFFKTSNYVSLQSLIAELKEELKTGCINLINKGSSLEDLDTYLFYIVNSHCKKRTAIKSKKRIEYVCPGCLFLGKETLIYFHKTFECEECQEKFEGASDPKWVEFFSCFKKHNKSGFRCSGCKRFVPTPFGMVNMIICPYTDCVFAGEISSLKKMHHPTSESNAEILSLDYAKTGSSIKDNLSSLEENVLSKLESKEELFNKVKIIKGIIEYQSNSAPYSSSDFTVKHKQLVYAAFERLLEQYPEDMVSYLLDNSRSGGFQHKIFQEYIKLLEDAFPLFVSKNKKMYNITSLLDENLCLFNGISIFESIVLSNLEIKNNTQEFYIGNRKGTYAKPYYIGKLLSVIDNNSKEPIINNVVEYTFNKIKLKNISAGTPVTVTHLRVAPHYQMGGMVYVNRIRKKIIERAHILMHK